MSHNVYTADDKEMLNRLIGQLGYADKQFYVDDSQWDAENKVLRLITAPYVTSVTLDSFIGTTVPYTLKNFAFVLVQEYKDGRTEITIFENFVACAEAPVVFSYLAEDNFNNLKLFFIEDFADNLGLIPVEFSCIINIKGASLNVENFGEIVDGKVVNRAVDGQASNKAFKDYLFTVYEGDDKHLVEIEGSFEDYLVDYTIEEVSLSNILELTKLDDLGHTCDTLGYFVSFESMNQQAKSVYETDKTALGVVLYNEIIKGIYNDFIADFIWSRKDEPAKKYLDFCKEYWRRIYEEGLK